MIEHYLVDSVPRPAGHYSTAVRAGDFLFISGQVPREADGSYTPASVAEETRLTLRNVQRIAEAAGFDLGSVVKVVAYLTSTDDFAEFNAAYAEFFPAAPPARTTVAVGLRQVQVEIDATLYVNQ